MECDAPAPVEAGTIAFVFDAPKFTDLERDAEMVYDDDEYVLR